MPAFVTGRLGPREPAGQALAIAVDGRIRATTRSYRHAGATRFAAVVPPSALGPGAHAIDVYAIAPGARTLRAVARAPAA